MDDRSLEWTQFLPDPARFVVFGGPEWLREQLELRSAGADAAPVAVYWEPQAGLALNPDAYQAVVALRPRGLRTLDLRSSGFTYVLRYAAFPSLSDARWFIPVDSPKVAEAAFGMYQPFKRHAAFKRSALQVLMRTGARAWYRDDVWIALRSESPLHLFANSMVSVPGIYLAISSGNPGPSRKPTLAALDDTGKIRAVLRVATSCLQRKLVENEAAMLQGLARLPRMNGDVPKLLGKSEFGTRLATAQSYLSGGNPPVQISEAHRRFLRQLQYGPTKPATETALVQALSQRSEKLPTTAQALARQAMAIIYTSLVGVMLPTTVNHGDFAPWNLRTSKDTVAAFDWEYGLMDGLPLVDEIHHQLQVASLVRKSTVSQSMDMLSDTSLWIYNGLTPENIAAVQMAHLLHRVLHWWEYNNGDVIRLYQFELLEHLVRRWGASGV